MPSMLVLNGFSYEQVQAFFRYTDGYRNMQMGRRRDHGGIVRFSSAASRSA